MHAIFIRIVVAGSQCAQQCMARQKRTQHSFGWVLFYFIHVDFSFDLAFYILREQLVSALTLNFSHEYGICILITSFITIKCDPLRVFLCHLPFRAVWISFQLSARCSPGSKNFNSLRLLRAIDFSFFHADCFASCLTDSSVRFIACFIICLSLWIHSWFHLNSLSARKHLDH